jgi:adenosylhomocysteine nucleosidase
MMRNGLVLTILLACVLLCGGSSREDVGQNADKPVTAIMGAFDKEVLLLADRLVDPKVRVIEEIRFVSGRLEGRDVVIVWTGIGKVNAAMTTTLMLEHFKPREVIFTGIAGGVNKELRPGDIVVASRVAHHDMGTLWPDALYYQGAKNPLTGWRNPVFFEADEQLLKLAENAAKEIDLMPIKMADGDRKPRVIEGVVVTGDVFVASPKKCDELRERLEADAVEMEGAAVAQLCYQRDVPCLVIRSLSDSADEGAMQDKQMFYLLAAENSSHLVREMMKLMGAAAARD